MKNLALAIKSAAILIPLIIIGAIIGYGKHLWEDFYAKYVGKYNIGGLIILFVYEHIVLISFVLAPVALALLIWLYVLVKRRIKARSDKEQIAKALQEKEKRVEALKSAKQTLYEAPGLQRLWVSTSVDYIFAVFRISESKWSDTHPFWNGNRTRGVDGGEKGSPDPVVTVPILLERKDGVFSVVPISPGSIVASTMEMQMLVKGVIATTERCLRFSKEAIGETGIPYITNTLIVILSYLHTFVYHKAVEEMRRFFPREFPQDGGAAILSGRSDYLTLKSVVITLETAHAKESARFYVPLNLPAQETGVQLVQTASLLMILLCNPKLEAKLEFSPHPATEYLDSMLLGAQIGVEVKQGQNKG